MPQTEGEQGIQTGSLLQAVSVSRLFGKGGSRVIALAPISLTIAKGDFLIINGPSGSGKSTLLNLLSGLDTPTKGEILFAGQSLGMMSPSKIAELRNSFFGFIFQSPHLLPDKTVFENIALPFHYGGLSDAKRLETRCMSLLRYVGLSDLAHRFPSTLSGGEMQRVVFARAIVREPQVIFADEPTGSLDSKNSILLVELLKEQADSGRTVVMVTHDPTLQNYGSRTLNLEKQKLSKVTI